MSEPRETSATDLAELQRRGYCTNIAKERIFVSHALLTRTSFESAYRSQCPVCDGGVLLVYRDQDARLSRRDRCTKCAQAVEYTDADINGEKFA